MCGRDTPKKSKIGKAPASSPLMKSVLRRHAANTLLSGPRLPPKSDFDFLYQADNMKSRKQTQFFIANQPLYTL